MNLRTRVATAIRSQDATAIDALVAADVRILRHLVSMTYDTDDRIRSAAARAIALAAHHYPQQVSELVRRLVWAMNDESGTNSRTAPEVIRAIASEQPDLLLPMIPDLLRLAADRELRPLLISAVDTVAQRYPTRVERCLHHEPSDCAVSHDGKEIK